MPNANAYKLKPCEMETTIRWDRQEREAHIFTADPFIHPIRKIPLQEEGRRREIGFKCRVKMGGTSTTLNIGQKPLYFA